MKAVSGRQLRDRDGPRRSGWSASRAAARRTTGRLVLQLLEPTSGSVRFRGVEVLDQKRGASCARCAAKMQIVFQDPYASLNPRMTVGSIIARAAAHPPRCTAATSSSACAS